MGWTKGRKGLMHVELLANGQKIVAMVDNRVSYNFVATREATRLGLKLSKDDSKLKIMNSQALEINGMAKDIPILLGG